MLAFKSISYGRLAILNLVIQLTNYFAKYAN